jgi:hypothetical protein
MLRLIKLAIVLVWFAVIVLLLVMRVVVRLVGVVLRMRVVGSLVRLMLTHLFNYRVYGGEVLPH